MFGWGKRKLERGSAIAEMGRAEARQRVEEHELKRWVRAEDGSELALSEREFARAAAQLKILSVGRRVFLLCVGRDIKGTRQEEAFLRYMGRRGVSPWEAMRLMFREQGKSWEETRDLAFQYALMTFSGHAQEDEQKEFIDALLALPQYCHVVFEQELDALKERNLLK